MNKIHLLFITILVEGYVVLASELLAMRQLIPFVGSGTEIVAIVISAVLMPLAVGYHHGGRAYQRLCAKRREQIQQGVHRAGHGVGTSIRKLLLKNIISALAILGIGLSYIFMELFFSVLQIIGVHDRIFQTVIYVCLFLVWPVFLLGQTVPLVSHYFSRRNLSEITGKMLFFSTTGSFFGSVFTTIVLMSLVGVHNTVILTLALLALLIPMLSRWRFNYEMVLTIFIISVVALMNNNQAIHALGIVSNNAYNTVALVPVKDELESRILNVNRSSSSKIAANPEQMFGYWKFIQNNFIAPISDTRQPPREILVIGAGGFTIGESDTHNHYTFIDIDPDLLKVSEQYFLKHPLSANKEFKPLSARAFLQQQSNKRYDLIILDAYTNVVSLPMECTTQEFFQAVKEHLKPEGIVIANAILSPTFDEKFSVRYFNTFASVFPQFTSQVIGDFDAWNVKDSGTKAYRNIILTYYNNSYVGDMSVYTDDRNTYSLDR